MHRPRIIPVLLMMSDGLLYKTQQFKTPKYVGDPRIAVKIFNDKCADELVLLDIDATREGREPNYDLIEEIAGEAFMPVAYGGGIDSLDKAKKIFSLGIEKIVINSAFFEQPELLNEISKYAGSQSVVCCIDVKRNWAGKYVCYAQNGQKKTKLSPEESAQKAQEHGAGEIIINSINNEGIFSGYNEALCASVAKSVSIPVVALGGARNIDDCAQVIKNTEISAAAAGSLFVFQGPHRAVLITFPADEELNTFFS